MCNLIPFCVCHLSYFESTEQAALGLYSLVGVCPVCTDCSCLRACWADCTSHVKSYCLFLVGAKCSLVWMRTVQDRKYDLAVTPVKYVWEARRRAHAFRKYAYSNILNIFQPKKETFQIKNSDMFSYSCSKHKLWVLVRTASMLLAK